MTPPRAAPSFTGRTRQRQTRWTIRAGDRIAKGVITVGGVATVIAVLAVAAYLVWVVVPLFLPAKVGEGRLLPIAASPSPPLQLGSDEYQTLIWILRADGTLDVSRADNGEPVQRLQPFADPPLTAAAFADNGQDVAFAFANGSVRLGRIGFATEFLDEDATPELADLVAGERLLRDNAIVERTVIGQLRAQRVDLSLDDPIPVAPGQAIVALDYAQTTTGPTFVALTADGRVLLQSVRTRRNMITGETTLQKTEGAVPFDPAERGLPVFVKITGAGDNVFLAWSDGRLVRYDARNRAAPIVAEEIDVLPDPNLQLTALGLLLGKTTLVAGDSGGSVTTWFTIKPPQTTQPDGSMVFQVPTAVPEWFRAAETVPMTVDGSMLVPALRLEGRGQTVTALGHSTRTRLLTIAYADGAIRIVHATSRKDLADLDAGDAPVNAIALSPRDDAILAVSNDAMRYWSLDPRYPEASAHSIFGKVWYEGYAQPEHIWQSSSGTDDFEIKLGLVPLIFGTIKATVISLLFGVPLALLAAIYTSEFLHPRSKARVKPTIETMASLPSVVLGFLAALVIAPYVERIVPAVLLVFFLVPATFLAGAVLWQLLPYHLTLRLAPYRLWFLLLVLPVGVWAAFALGPLAERGLFDGDIKLWLSGRGGTGLGGWLLLFVPVSAVLAGFVLSRLAHPWLRARSRQWSRRQFAAADLVKFCIAAAFTLAFAWALAFAFTAMGLDPRGSFLGTYDQRNALIVGFIMGFAIIPIIYTISEDALSAVPEHLRAASLGAGATPWQTATRIIIPTAMSGLFSAVMVGLGRAVGETMIVLMAAGNTPLMEWNIFNGFRTLSANIAVEMPEAVRGETHYRALFLAALVLFAMTFALNTAAEAIRQRFRKRAYQL